MFSVSELCECMSQLWFKEGYQAFERSLLSARLGMRGKPQIPVRRTEMSRFSQAVLASVTAWKNPRGLDERNLCAAAADIEVALSVLGGQDCDYRGSHHHLLRAAILYDIGGMPGTAASYAVRDGLVHETKAFFSRSPNSFWGILAAPKHKEPMEDVPAHDSISLTELLNIATGEILEEFGKHLQDPSLGEPRNGVSALNSIATVAAGYNTDLNQDVVQALSTCIELRRNNSIFEILKPFPTLETNLLRRIRVPAELWPVQRAAIEGGLLKDQFQSFGIAAPTGTGKTALTRLLLADFFSKHPDKKALYISPSRALTSQIAKELYSALVSIDISVAALGAKLTVSEQMTNDARHADLIVFTPEKADLLLRVDPQLVEKTGLVIVDEAHHIEQGTRGILLEFYLWRLKSIIPRSARIIQLSAVTPNIGELVGWLGTRKASAHVKMEWRANRLRLGIFETTRGGGGAVRFEDNAPYLLIGPGQCSPDRLEGLAQLAQKLSESGIVLVLSTSPPRAEKIAKTIADSREQLQKPISAAGERLDARIERELYADSPLREYYSKRVAFHHAQLPPRIRVALEEAIAAREIDIVCATTTLAEGVNFPFSTVVVESLVGKNFQISPRALWNIAGRAGRFGVDSEGHCILFRPSLYKDRLTQYRLEEYVKTELDSIPIVKSALATAIGELKEATEKGEIDIDELSAINLDTIKIGDHVTDKAKRIRGLINVMRVGYAHASMSGTISLEDEAAQEFESEQLLAARQMDSQTKKFASYLGSQQRNVIRTAIESDKELLSIAARIGWSLETQNAIVEWLRGLRNWQLEQFSNLVVGGQITNAEKLSYLIGPLAKRMTEFEGDTLGGFTAYIAEGWLEGLPLTTIREAQEKKFDFGRLVRVIYARVQYLLPWALFGLNELLRYEAGTRRMRINSGVADLSLLASEGVPSFDALQLVLQLDIERVDATRIASHYRRAKRGMDIIGWFKTQQWPQIVKIVRGPDQRRLDPDLKSIWESRSGV